MFLLSLGKYIAIPLLTEWIDLIDLVKVDSAICNNGTRYKFLGYFEVHTIQFQNVLNRHDIVVVKGLNAWLQCRKLSLKRAVLESKRCSLVEDEICVTLAGLEHIRISYYWDERILNIMDFGDPFVNLQNIELCSIQCNLVNRLLEKLSSKVHCLLSITLVDCDVSDGPLVLLCRSNSGLKTLCADVNSAKLMMTLIVHCQSLQTVKLYYMNMNPIVMFLVHSKSLTCTSFLSFPLVLSYHGPRLVDLCLDWSHANWELLNVPLSQLCPRLQSLSINAYCPVELLNLPVNLITLYTDFIPLNDDLLTLLGRSCPNLQSLTFNTINVSVSVSGFSMLPNLRELEVDMATKELLTSLALHCGRLEKLSLFSGADNYEVELRSVLRSCEKISYLTVSVNTHLELLGVIGSTAGGRLKELCLIVAHYDRRFSSEFEMMLSYCTQLVSLVYRSENLSDTSLVAISKCTKLRTLDVSGCVLNYVQLKKCVQKLSRLVDLKTTISNEKHVMELAKIVNNPIVF